MERLTVEKDFCNFIECHICRGVKFCRQKAIYDNVFNKLKEYEDLEEQGLLLKLPCKVGDVVYHENPYSTIYVGIQAYQITNIMISQNKKGEWTKKYRAMRLHNGKTVDHQLNFAFEDIGETVFITKAEAEKKLAEMGE
jgi:hypothetical protein